MPIIVPPPENTIDISAEITHQRRLTTWFIASSPVQIELIPSVETRTASGAVAIADATPREIQTFRLLPVSSNERPARGANEQGAQRKYDFTIMGEWNCDMAEGDHWTDDFGQQWQIDSILSFNGYERKGMVMSYGRRPTHA